MTPRGCSLRGRGPLRGETLTAAEARQTACHKGHEFSEANTRMTKRGTRMCRACDRDRAREYRRRAAVSHA